MAKRPKSHGTSRRQQMGASVLTDAPSRRMELAQRTWADGQRNDALTLFAEAVREEPNNVRGYLLLARALAECYDFERMERTLDRLIRRAPRHPGVHHYIGEIYANLKLPDRAEESYTKAVRLPGAGPPTWMELAALHERAHRLDEAKELIERAVSAGYDLPNVGLVRGRIQQRQGLADAAAATFHQVIERVPESEFACEALGELALMCDHAGNFVGAIAAIEQCKRIQRAHDAPHWAVAERVHSQMGELIDGITANHFQRWSDQANNLDCRQMALLTGFPRSGTTLLEQLLDSHPEIVSSEERDFIGTELLFTVLGRFGKLPLLQALNELPLDQVMQQRCRYFRSMEYLLNEPIGDRLHLDKNPAYNLLVPVILRFFPETRLIVALRDPRDVVLSCYLRHLPLNALSVNYLDLERTARRYAFDMSGWLKFRDLVKTPFCEIHYEDTVADAGKQAGRALDTLSLPWDNQVLEYRQRLEGSKRVTSPTYAAVAEPVYTRAIGRWKNYERWLEPVMPVLAPFIREFGYET